MLKKDKRVRKCGSFDTINNLRSSSQYERKKKLTTGGGFSDFSDFSSHSQPSIRKFRSANPDLETHTSKVIRRRNQKVVAECSWAEKNTPRHLADLAVHKKKVSSVQELLDWCFSSNLKTAPIIILSGPTGCGKTTTLLLLCKSMKIEVSTWEVPPNFNMEDNQIDRELDEYGRIEYGEKQMEIFSDFLFKSNEFQTLFRYSKESLLSGVKKINLVEDLLPVFFENLNEFHNVLREYKRCGTTPLVFIISDSSSSEWNMQKLFNPSTTGDLSIINISFNAIAPTILYKSLNRIANLEKSQDESLQLPDKRLIEDIIASNPGDIRCCINALQIAMVSDKGLNTKSTKEYVHSSKGRDSGLFLFHALGKILYAKREEIHIIKEVKEESEPPAELYRKPLKENPEEVFERVGLTADCFSSFLQQNYLDFYGDIYDIANTAEAFSVVDTMVSNWNTRSSLEGTIASYASRSIMFYNTKKRANYPTNSKKKLQPLKKPLFMTVRNQMGENKQNIERLFQSGYWKPLNIATELIPFIKNCNCCMCTMAQKSCISRSFSFRGNLVNKSLDQMEAVDMEVTDKIAYSKRSFEVKDQLPKTPDPPVNDPELKIEEFDSD
ncbi:DgyrCDS14101 [Dimorphilus gyrociliatus]|uniref:DgyrCDS14101 n=1 Tax=Dimorphilus gyrociliatus TaxID=2664684 RepID=A0A7I8WCK7_9ANNE|nr:DgyrCDS14101 [Dimorphilus gyrociliatus]